MHAQRDVFKVVIEQLEKRVLLDGALDPNFGAGGIVYLKPASDIANVATRSDGTVIAHAHRYSHDDFLYKLQDDGSVDLNYGDINGAEAPGGFDVGMQSDNRLLYVTSTAIARYSPTGVREAEFHGPKLNASGTAATSLETFVVLPDNSFALAGRNTTKNFSGIEWFNGDGTSRISISQSNTIVSMAGQADGKLVVLLNTSNGQVLERFNTNGQLDSTFANDKTIPAPSDPDPEVKAVAHYSSVSIDSLGRIYVGGFMPENTADYQQVIVLRYLATGQLDASYGASGMARGFPTAPQDRGSAFRVAGDGRMYIAATLWPLEEERTLTVWRLNADGSADRTWGANGTADVDVTLLTKQGNIPTLGDLQFMSDGDVVVSGIGTRPQNANPAYPVGVVVRFNVDPAPVSVVNNGGTLTVTGRPLGDTIYLKTLTDGRISVTANGVTRKFAAGSVNSVLVSGGGGDDYIDASALDPLTTAPTTILVTLTGDTGKDAILGSQGNDRIVGGEANDRIAGLAGNDWISGSAQSDRISGGSGNDSVLGNGGRDYLSGDDGNDTLLGGDQPDVLAGGNGDDSLAGEGGHDHLDGGTGIDHFSGGGGNDTFFAADGNTETIVGGIDALDTAYVDKTDLLVGIETPIVQ